MSKERNKADYCCARQLRHHDIGIPFGKMHFRLAKLALSPFGKEVV